MDAIAAQSPRCEVVGSIVIFGATEWCTSCLEEMGGSSCHLLAKVDLF